jgi:hypothetical protein
MVERKSTIRDDIIAVRPSGAEALWHGDVKDKGWCNVRSADHTGVLLTERAVSARRDEEVSQLDPCGR